MESKVIKFGKLLLSVFIIYSMWYKEAFTNVPLVLYGTVIIATACIGIVVTKNRFQIPLFKFIVMLFVYGVYSFFTGLIISSDKSWFISMMVTYFAFILVCFDCSYISKYEESTEWILNAFKISSILCAVQTIFFGVEYQTEVMVRTMSKDNNPHTLGLVMVLGIFAFTSKKKNIDKGIIKTIIAILVFSYVIILSGSRKSLFCAGILIVMWVFFLLKANNTSKTKKILMFFSVAIMFGIGVFYINKFFFESAIYERLLMLNSGTNTRSELFKTAIEYWKQSPIVGIGFGQYQIWSPLQLYSHSAYAEILSCTGIIGFIIFFGIMLKYTIRLIKYNIWCNTEQRYDFRMVLSMFIIEWILGIGQIYIYSAVHLLLLTYLVMSIDYIPQEYK
ncbi:TPA: O-antigen ligase family protein [Clostridium perfringens]|uniref:O-antigen ligase family protein n=2 Tax=Clostridium perfringens TaxID=1502 RepID=UPI001A30BDEF|nr:O-antigen ligase family protein [Clostridium perfringens]EJT6151361.1 O-antigen ligase family protein [Clostridium perfringens]MDK0532874.1 O-antigen ligase family protein [Clostridium perfringens]MDU3334158.1 O-antigen ligase family protein [Clostridium perfringens]MEA5268313.1 O-antigen ligase family protein [Clostridium perfringens]UUR87334.1 O-antigen ligase family protein [Clostridium perfringens]